MITYNDLYEALRKEKYSDILQTFAPNFLEDIAQYFNEKKSFSEKDQDLFSDIAIKNKKKLENAITNFKELIRLRKKKILNLAFVASEVGISKKDFENLFSFEKQLFEEIVKSLEKADNELNGIIIGQKNQQKYRLVRFLADVPEFLNFEGEEIGPFEKGEVANLDNEVISVLVNDKKAEVIEED